jgi:hypothetical protein
MHMRHGLLAILLLTPQVVLAQGSSHGDSLPVPHAVQQVLDLFDKPLHPVVGGVATSGGMGVGLGYTTPRERAWYHDAEGRVTVKRYWLLTGEAGRQTSRARLGTFGSVRDMRRLDFFGIGPDSQLSDHTDFRLRETNVGARVSFKVMRNVRVGGSASFYDPDLGSGRSRSLASIEDRFDGSNVPGLGVETWFTRYRGFAELIHPLAASSDQDQDETRLHRQGRYQVAVESVRDHDLGRYNFHRLEAEVQQRIPGLRPGQRLTLHGLLAATPGHGEVPFYLQYTLGGGGGLAAFRPETIGGDGSRATLRSFDNYRFRDRNVLLMQAEYRVPLHPTVHATIFLDSGQVAPRASGLFQDLKVGTGFSLSYMRNGAARARVDVGYGSGEGVHVYWGVGGRLR